MNSTSAFHTLFEGFSCATKIKASLHGVASSSEGSGSMQPGKQLTACSSPESPVDVSQSTAKRKLISPNIKQHGQTPGSQKKKRQEPDLSNAPGVPARLGSKPLRLIIVGANPSEHAWLSGHYYSNPGNWMWRILKGVGIAPSCIRGAQDDAMMQTEAGVGFIDVGVGHPGTQLSAISSETFQSWIDTFYQHLADHLHQANQSVGCKCGACGSPAVVAFSGKRQFMELMNHGRPKREHLKKLDLGVQAMAPQGWPLPLSSELWVMTSTSGASPMTNEERFATWRALALRIEKIELPRTPCCPACNPD